MPYPLFIALRYLRFHRGRTFLSVISLISVGGVCVGTAALVIALSLNAGFVDDVHQRIYSGSAHLTVMSLQDEWFEGGDRIAARAEAVDGVRVAGAILFTPAMLLNESYGSPEFTELHGVDPAKHARVVHDDDWESSPFLELARAVEGGRPGIVLGQEMAVNVGAVVGDRVRVIVPEMTLAPWGPQPRSRVFEVVGTFASGHYQQDTQRAYVHIASAGRLMKAAGRSSWLEVRLDDLDELETMKQTLKDELGQPWIVIDLIEQNGELLKALNTEKLLLFLAIGLIVVVAAMNIVSTLILMVTDKVKEIGTLTAMGARADGIATIFMLQGIVIGVVGTIAGLVLGALVAWGLDRMRLIPLDPEVYYLDHVPFHLQPMDFVVVGIAALVISFLATLYPAWRAARLRPVEAIRYE